MTGSSSSAGEWRQRRRWRQRRLWQQEKHRPFLSGKAKRKGNESELLSLAPFIPMLLLLLLQLLQCFHSPPSRLMFLPLSSLFLPFHSFFHIRLLIERLAFTSIFFKRIELSRSSGLAVCRTCLLRHTLPLDCKRCLASHRLSQHM